MTAFDHFWLLVVLVLLIAGWLGSWAERRRNRSAAEFRRRHRDRKAEVERAARRSL